MKNLKVLADRAGSLARRSFKRADALVNGDSRARARFAALGPEGRRALGEVVREELGERQWREFGERVILGGG